MADNSLGSTDPVAYDDYGQNHAGVWSEGLGSQALDVGGDYDGDTRVEVVDAALWTLENADV